MDKNSNNFQTHCTWKSLDGKNITEAVCWTDGIENPDIEETIQAENCLLLEAGNNDNPGTVGSEVGSECRIIFFCHPPFFIQQITVLCEARLIEVYGRHGEYLKTIRNEMVDEVDDMIVFRGDVKLERPNIECSLKFTGLKSKSSMWLYGVTVKIGTAVSPSSGPVGSSSLHGNNVFQTAPPPNQLVDAGTDRNQNNAQFVSLMTSMFGAQRPSVAQHQPLMSPNSAPSMWTPAGNESSNLTPSGPAAMNGIPSQAHPAAQFLQNLIKPVPGPSPPDMMSLFLSMMQGGQSPYNSQQQQQHQQMAAMMAQLQPNLALNQQNQPLTNNQTVQQQQQVPNTILSQQVPSQAQSENVANSFVPAADNSITNELITRKIEDEIIEKTDSEIIVKESKETATSLVIVEKQTPSKPVDVKETSDSQASPRELAVELRPETVDQITEAVINNVDCSLENLEARLWGKIVHRLSEMETRILARMEEVVDALREEDEDDERLAEVVEDYDDEEPLSGDGSVLEI